MVTARSLCDTDERPIVSRRRRGGEGEKGGTSVPSDLLFGRGFPFHVGQLINPELFAYVIGDGIRKILSLSRLGLLTRQQHIPSHSHSWSSNARRLQARLLRAGSHSPRTTGNTQRTSTAQRTRLSGQTSTSFTHNLVASPSHKRMKTNYFQRTLVLVISYLGGSPLSQGDGGNSSAHRVLRKVKLHAPGEDAHHEG